MRFLPCLRGSLSCLDCSVSVSISVFEDLDAMTYSSYQKGIQTGCRCPRHVTGQTRESGEDLDFLLESLLMCHNIPAALFSPTVSPSFSLIMLGVMTGGHQIKGSGPEIISEIGYAAIKILL